MISEPLCPVVRTKTEILSSGVIMQISMFGSNSRGRRGTDCPIPPGVQDPFGGSARATAPDVTVHAVVVVPFSAVGR
ncbi:hypothetical protein ACIBM8_28710 [Micromonospora aurantiaca]|uniref:hypothetical protein n=1 Tax=Micromonospora aurantiaca (nom. illeg.) TaxID=47850 RepID=UPI003798745C